MLDFGALAVAAGAEAAKKSFEAMVANDVEASRTLSMSIELAVRRSAEALEA